MDEPMADDLNDVALSFAGEQREYVRAVAEHLKAADVRVYYDEFEGTNQWGRDLAAHFDDVFRKRSRFVVPFLSKEYAAKAWPRHELKSALARAVEAKDRYILPVRFDNTDIPGLQPTIRYEDGTKLRPKEIAEKIVEVLGKGKQTAKGKPEPAVAKPSRVPRVPPTDFNPYAEAENAVAHLRRELAGRAKTLEGRGYAVHAQDRDGRFGLRIMRSGQTVYSLDVWIGEGIGENTIHFSTGSGGYVSPGSWNAHGRMEWDRSRDLPVVKLFNMSLLPDLGRDYSLTPGELADAIWDEICDRLEKRA